MTSDVLMQTSQELGSQKRNRPASKGAGANRFLKVAATRKNLCAMCAILLGILIVSFAVSVKDNSGTQAKVYVRPK